MVSFRDIEVFFWLFKSSRGKEGKDRKAIAWVYRHRSQRTWMILPTRRDRPRATTSQMIHLPDYTDAIPLWGDWPHPRSILDQFFHADRGPGASGETFSRQMEKKRTKEIIGGLPNDETVRPSPGPRGSKMGLPPPSRSPSQDQRGATLPTVSRSWCNFETQSRSKAEPIKCLVVVRPCGRRPRTSVVFQREV